MLPVYKIEGTLFVDVVRPFARTFARRGAPTTHVTRRAFTGVVLSGVGAVAADARRARRRRGRRGGTLVYAVILMTALLAVSSLGVDVAHVHLARTELQRTADAAARAGAGAMFGTPAHPVTSADPASAAAAAGQVASLNPADGRAVSLAAGDVEVGNWDDTLSPRFATGRSPTNAVRVTSRLQRDRGSAVALGFTRMLGFETWDVSAAAVARVDPPTSPYGLVGIDRIRFASLGVLAEVNGDLMSNGDIDVGTPLGLLVRVNGDARSYHGTVSKGALACITGSTAPLSSPLYYPTVLVPAANDNSRIASQLDSHGNFTSALGWTLPAGTYVVRDLNMLAGIAVNVEGPVTVYVTGNMNIAAGVNLFGSANTDPANFRVRVVKGGCVNFLAELLTPVYMDVYAPDSDITVAVGVNHYRGRLIGKSLNIALPVLGRVTEESGLGVPGGRTGDISLVQ